MKNNFVICPPGFFSLIIFTLLFLFSASVAVAETTYRFARFWPPLQQPWYFESPSGIAVDRDNYVYVTDLESHRIRKFTADGRLVAIWGKYGGSAGEFNEPHDIASDNQGFLYVADTGNQCIQKFTTDGQFVAPWKETDAWKGPDGLFYPVGIAIDSLGFLYVLNSYDLCVHKYTTEGVWVEKWRCKSWTPGDTSLIFGIDVDDDGFVYVVDPKENTIQKFTNDGTPVNEWGGFGSESGQLDLPAGIALDQSGNLYVSDRDNDRIQKFTSDGVFVTQWGVVGSAGGDFISPGGIAVGPNGLLYIADWNNSRVQVFTRNGEFLFAWESRGDLTGEFDTPKGIATDQDGNLYVVDTNNNRVQKFDAGGRFLLEWNGDETEDGIFFSPIGIAVYKDFVYVADTGHHKVRRFTLSGEQTDSWGEEGTNTGQFRFPYDIAAGPDQNGNASVYVIDRGNYRVQKFDPQGQFLGKLGEYGSEDGQFIWPDGIALYEGKLFVTDSSSNDRIQIFPTDGTQQPSAVWDVSVSSIGIDSAGGIVVSPEGIFVTDVRNDRIVQLDHTGHFVQSIGQSGYGTGDFRSPGYLCLTPDGNLCVTDTGNNRVQLFKPVDASRGVTRAVIVAGGGPYSGNQLWDATRMNASFAYRVLNYQGIPAENIRYLTADTDIDLNGDRQPDSVSVRDTTLANFTDALAWAGEADQMVVYLIDHGGLDDEALDGNTRGLFRLSPSETVSAEFVGERLESFQGQRLLVIYDACKSGSFLSGLQTEVNGSNTERIVITSTSPDEDAYFLSQGAVSFSSRFWTEIFNGSDLKDAFTVARDAMRNIAPQQNGQADGNGDGMDDQENGYALLVGKYIGNQIENTETGPVIKTVSDPITLINQSDAEITATVENAARVWAVVRPPEYDQAVDVLSGDDSFLELPSFELKPSGSDNSFAGTYTGFTETGIYDIFILAGDKNGNTAQPETTSVTVNTRKKRRAVLIAGEPPSEDAWPLVKGNLEAAYKALRFQGYRYDQGGDPANNTIYILSPESLAGGFDGKPTLGNVRFALESWGATDTRDIVIYMLCGAESGEIRLSGTETLSPQTLRQWLDVLQTAINGQITLVLETGYSGDFLPYLSGGQQTQRTIITGSAVEEPLFHASQAALPFSSHFWKEILNGASVGQAFRRAQSAVRLMTQAPPDALPRIDSNGNGIANERADTAVAENLRIGYGFRLAANDPSVGLVPSDITVASGEPVTIWAEGITSTGSVDHVEATIYSPHQQEPLSPVPPDSLTLLLTGDGSGRYSASYDADAGNGNDYFQYFGRYHASVVATEASGNTSEADPLIIYQPFGMDIYETDDTFRQAGSIVISYPQPQFHNFHLPADEDWIHFYALQAQDMERDFYTFRISFPDRPFPVLLTLYNENLNPIEEKEVTANDSFLEASFTASGEYFIKLSLPEGTEFDPELSYGYGIKIFRPVGVFAGFVKGSVTDPSGNPISSAQIFTDAHQTGLSRPNGRFMLLHDSGNFTMTIEAEGYAPQTLPVTVSELGTTVFDITLTPNEPIPPPPTPRPPADRFPFARIISPSSDLTILPGESVLFQGAAGDGDGPLSVAWDFDGAMDPEFGASLGQKVFETPGVYLVRFTVTDADGDSNSDSVTIMVIDTALPDTTPNIIITSPEDGAIFAEGESVRFSAQIEGGNPPYTYEWDFGDVAGIFTEDHPVIRFAVAGEWPVTVTVTDTDGDLDRAIVTVIVIADTQNDPVVPQVVFPHPGAEDVALTPLLRTAGLLDDEEEFIHSGTHWQIAKDAAFSEFVMDLKTTAPRFFNEIPIQSLILDPETAYFWRVKYEDSDGKASEWSAAASFTTQTSPLMDQNSNGIPDEQEVGPETDLDDDGRPDAMQGMAVIQSAVGNSRIGVKIGETSADLEALRSVHPLWITDDEALADAFPLGLITFRLRTVQPGDTASLSVFFTRPVPAEAVWVIFDEIHGWRDDTDIATLAPDLRSFTLQITDGGSGDADGTENGVIIHEGGFALHSDALKPLLTAPPEPDNVGGVGCFIDAVLPI